VDVNVKVLDTERNASRYASNIEKQLVLTSSKVHGKYSQGIGNCTKAETGVGAAMAVGNHEERGIWALLVIAAKTKRKEINPISTEPDINSR
jgi:hypothetical protein